MSRKIMNEMNIFFEIQQDHIAGVFELPNINTGSSQNIVAGAPYFAGQNEKSELSKILGSSVLTLKGKK